MTSDSSPLPDAFMALEGAYLDTYNAIVQPKQLITISRYLIEHWTSYLDPIEFWLVVELRQRCEANARRRDKVSGQGMIRKRNWWRGKQSALADTIHVSRRTLIRKMSQQDENNPPFNRFILSRKAGRRYSQRAGRSVPRSYRYTVALDDPLTPTHQAALGSLLDVQAEDLADVLQELLKLGNGDLYRLLDQPAQHSSPAPWLPTVSDVVRDLHGAAVVQRENIARLCSELNHNITRPDLVVLAPWYFRDRWLPRLKHKLALLILLLRARCYYNAETGADRNEIEVNWAQIRKQLGIGRTQMYKLRDHPDLPKFYRVLEEPAGRKPARVKVGMRRIPLVPEDEELFGSLVMQQGSCPIDPETGQMELFTRLSGTERAEKPFTFDTFGHQKPFAFGTFGHEKPFTLGTFGKSKPFTFDTQTSIALKDSIAPGRASSTALAESETATQRQKGPRTAADISNMLSLSQFREKDEGAYEILVPVEWADALEGVDSDSDRVSVLIDMARDLGLSPPTHQIGRRELGQLMLQHGGGTAGAQTLAAALWYLAIVGMENVAGPGLGSKNQVSGILGSKNQVSGILGSKNQVSGILGSENQVSGMLGPKNQVSGMLGPKNQVQAAQDPASDVPTLLDRLGIQEPSRSTLLEAGASYADAMAWTLYAATQPGLTDNPTGYVVRRLLSGEAPPAEFADLAILPLESITLFRRAVRYGGPYREAIPAEAKPLFRDWKRRFSLEEQRREKSRHRHGREWDPADRGVQRGDGLEDLLGDVTVDPVEAWAAACDRLEGQIPDGDLALLRECKPLGQGQGYLVRNISLLPDDARMEEVLSAHLDAVRAALAGLGIYHEVEVMERLDPITFFEAPDVEVESDPPQEVAENPDASAAPMASENQVQKVFGLLARLGYEGDDATEALSRRGYDPDALTAEQAAYIVQKLSVQVEGLPGR